MIEIVTVIVIVAAAVVVVFRHILGSLNRPKIANTNAGMACAGGTCGGCGSVGAPPSSLKCSAGSK